MNNTEHKDETSTYRTKDLAEATALLVGGQKMAGLNREGSVCWFLFKDIVRCKNMANDYMFGDLEVNAREFAETFRRLKIMIFADK